MKERRNTCYDYFNDFVQLCVSYLNYYDPCNTIKVISIAIRPHKRLASAYTFASNWNQFSALRERTSVEMYQDESPRMLSGWAGLGFDITTPGLKSRSNLTRSQKPNKPGVLFLC